MGFLKKVMIVFLVIVILVLGVGYYLYEFHVFKTFRVCTSSNLIDTKFNCNTNEECLDKFIESNIDDMPVFIRDGMTIVFNEAVYCENTCMVREIYGFGEELDSCKDNDKEFLFEIRGKDALMFVKESL